MSVAWQTIRARLVVMAPVLLGAGVTVWDGPVVNGDNPDRYLAIASQPSAQSDNAGTFEQSEPPDGFMIRETGSVLCELSALTGDPSVPDAFGMYGILAAWVQTNPTLGILVVGSAVSITADVLQAQQTSGAVQRLLLSVNYTANLL